MQQFISNNNLTSHQSVIEKLLYQADAVYIMVAFLKVSGLKMILHHLGHVSNVKIIAGANFGLTEPAALTQLLEKSYSNQHLSAYLNRMDSKQIFHPKMYLLKIGQKGHIIIGSANLTQGGLYKNNECSLHIECLISDKVWLDAQAHFEKCILPENADNLSERVIGIYRNFYMKQKKINDQSEEFPDVSTSTFYDLDKLMMYFKRLDKRQMKKDMKAKIEHYQEARNILDRIASGIHSDLHFRELIEDLVGRSKLRGFWYSNGMFRGKAKVFAQQDKFRKLLLNIKGNLDESPKKIYEEARALSRDIIEVGPNYIGEIMMSYAPDKLANINRNPITVLREEGGVDLKAHSQSFNGTDYQEYNSIIKEISHKLGLKNMLEADYFFNEIYQELKKYRNENNG